MRAEELATEFGVAGVLDFVNTQHGLVKATISLDSVVGELYLQGAQVTAWRLRDERPVLFTSPKSAFCARAGDPRRHPDHIPVVRSESARAHGATARLRAHRDLAPRRGRNRGEQIADHDPQSHRRRCRLDDLAGAISRDLHRDLRTDSFIAARRAEPREASDRLRRGNPPEPYRDIIRVWGLLAHRRPARRAGPRLWCGMGRSGVGARGRAGAERRGRSGEGAPGYGRTDWRLSAADAGVIASPCRSSTPCDGNAVLQIRSAPSTPSADCSTRRCFEGKDSRRIAVYRRGNLLGRRHRGRV